MTALLHSGQGGEHHSPPNQAVSDLGEVAISELAWLALVVWHDRGDT